MSELMLSKIGKSGIEFPILTGQGYGQAGYNEWLWGGVVSKLYGAAVSEKMTFGYDMSGSYRSYPEWFKTAKNVYIYYAEKQMGAMSGEWFDWYDGDRKIRCKMTMSSGGIYYEATEGNPNVSMTGYQNYAEVVLMNLDAIN